MHNNTVYEWILRQFSISARAHSFQQITPHLSTIVKPGDRVLDLCCGAGPVAFWLEEQGCQVKAIDFAPYMIALAKAEAAHRKSSIDFIEADLFSYDLGKECYDLVTCFGNSISDFPLQNYLKLVRLVFSALKPGGRFVLDYHDGSYLFMQRNVVYDGVYQETPESITFHRSGYLPEIGASVNTICNETRGETYVRKAYIYTVPVVQVITGTILALEYHVTLGENHFLDIYSR